MLCTSVEVGEETWCGGGLGPRARFAMAEDGPVRPRTPLGSHYSEAKQPTQLFSSENNSLTHDL